MNNLAAIRISRGAYLEAETLIRQALEIFHEGLPDGHWRVLNAESILGASLTGLGRYGEAEALLLRSYPVVRDAQGASSLYARSILEHIIFLYDAWGKPMKAAEYHESLTTARSSDG